MRHSMHASRHAEKNGAVAESGLEVDVLINAVAKDLDVLPLTVAGVRRHLLHPVGEIIIVGPRQAAITDFCESTGCRFQDEDEAVPIRLKDVNFAVGGHDRSGWIFQQLIKLNCGALSDKSHVYVIDADTVLVRDQKFERDGKEVLLSSDEFHLPYREAFKRIFGFEPSSDRSFVAHQMLFDVGRLGEMKREMEASHGGNPWFRVILDNLDASEMSSFSEFETYGNWMLRRYPDDIVIEYWENRSFAKGKALKLHLFFARLLGLRSASFHSYSQGLIRRILALFIRKARSRG